jgi:signal peptide peptidase SppA
MKGYSRIVRAIRETPWAIQPAKLEAICELIELRAQGIIIRGSEEFQNPTFAAASVPAKTGGAIAVLPLFGVISQRMSMMDEISGGTSTEKFTSAFRAALNDSSVKAIVLNIDSPGGSVYGVDELSSEIYKARGQKQIVAIANSLSASAAYYIGSAAEEFNVTPGGEVGSIGVFCAHFDESKFMEGMGVQPTLISAGKYKTEGNPYQPLTEEAKAALQSRVDDYYGMFLDAVARNRNTTAKKVTDGYGQGRVVGATEAVSTGLADRVSTFDQVLSRLGAGAPARNAARAEAVSDKDIDIRRRRARAAAACL